MSTNNKSNHNIKKSSVKGAGITLFSQGISIFIQIISTVILARLLNPDDYGILAMVMSVTVFAGIFRDLGLSSAAIQKKVLTNEQQSNLFWLNIAVGLTLTLVVSLMAPVVVWFYERPELLWVTMVMSLSFVFTSLGAQSGAILIRNMQFGLSSLIKIVGATVTLIIAVFCTLSNLSYWSLVLGNLAGALATSLLLLKYSPFTPTLPTKGAGIRSMVHFGANVTAFNFVNYFSRNLDNILIGRFVGASALGTYSKAYQLLLFPITAIVGPLNSVAFPAMSRLDSKSAEYRDYYMDLIRILALITMPIMVFMHSASEEVIIILLGDQWTEVIPIFSALAFVGLIQPVSSMRGLILLSSGESKKYLHAGLFTTIFVSISFLIGISHGVMGIVWAYVIIEWLLVLPMHIYASKNTSITNSDLLKAIFSPLTCAILAGGCLYIINLMILDYSILIGLLIKSTVIVFFAVISIVISKNNRRVFFGVLRHIQQLISERSKKLHD
ncbi:lipopolysaccharide biosynthesis protein [Vibrio sp. 10N.261.51.C6]|uniref:lipopolysaccharide biosynthesis protein n=1 Tax=Vibrio sp. 10N.261.51.C6 TaxID=3229676 RepID=UPI00354B9897